MSVTVQNLNKTINGVKIYDNLTLKAKKGKITAIFGPNGSGKSTLFNIIARITNEDKGKITLGNSLKNNFSYVFQNYRDSLLPWMTNFENLAFPLRVQHIPNEIVKKKIVEFQKQLNLTLPLEKYPYELSGGQQQLLAFFRALITNPELLLLDEPFSALDYENNLKLLSCLQKYHELHKPTVLIITHDIEEAVFLADEILVLSKKPSKVVAMVNNVLSRPRNLETLRSEAFHEIKNKVLVAFQQEVN